MAASDKIEFTCDACGKARALAPAGTLPSGWHRLHNVERASAAGVAGRRVDLCPKCSKDLSVAEVWDATDDAKGT